MGTGYRSLITSPKEYPIVKQRMNQVDSANIAITIVTLEEQMKGWLNVINKYNDQPSQFDRLILAYKGLRDGIEYFNKVRVLDFDRLAYNCYKELIRQRIRIGTKDLRIAAIALSVNGILVTRNRRDFKKVPNLELEDWTVS